MSKKILSIFVDESGDFGTFCAHSPYYLVTLLFHEQNINISDNIELLDQHIKNLGFPKHNIHTGPLIRREAIYKNECKGILTLIERLSKAILLQIRINQQYLSSFEKIIIYYDNNYYYYKWIKKKELDIK